MAFSFGFKSEDIDDDSYQDEEMVDDSLQQAPEHDQNLEPVQWHTLEEMLCTIPSQVSYTFHTVSHDPPLRLPRRDLFDIRAQLLAETDVTDVSLTALADILVSDDIKPKLYEGGFKTWECSLDLAQLVLNQGRSPLLDDHVVELGSGTAIPSCIVLYQLLRSYPPGTSSTTSHPCRTLILADYNEHVLTHASIVNLLLTFAKFSPTALQEECGELSVDTVLVNEFRGWLSNSKIQVFGISGPWSPHFLETINMQIQGPKLILASETIYQPETIQQFVRVLLGLMRADSSGHHQSQALIAAKKVYFGVGGGIDEFLSCLKGLGENADMVWESGEAGVGRAILSIRHSNGVEIGR